ncbi:MAG: LysE family transporter [Trueperaceae bacterium]|nr:LysE family transporter [Trueperaceae bacterium]
MEARLLIPMGEGFLLGLGLIMGIGPQNSFILQNALRRQYVFLMIVLASLIDISLIGLGVGGAASFITQSKALLSAISLTGAAFLLGYGWRSFRSALRPDQPLRLSGRRGTLECKTIVLGILAVSLLNPSTYLDTMFLIGGNAAHYDEPLRLFFALGASIASIVWFFLLACGAANFSKWLARPWATRVIDVFSGLIMWLLALRLLLHLH